MCNSNNKEETLWGLSTSAKHRLLKKTLLRVIHQKKMLPMPGGDETINKLTTLMKMQHTDFWKVEKYPMDILLLKIFPIWVENEDDFLHKYGTFPFPCSFFFTVATIFFLFFFLASFPFYPYEQNGFHWGSLYNLSRRYSYSVPCALCGVCLYSTLLGCLFPKYYNV